MPDRIFAKALHRLTSIRHFGSADEHMLRTIKYHGQNRRCSLEDLRDADLVITTYHTLASDYSNAKGLLDKVEWYRLVLDEGVYSHLFLSLNLICYSAHHPPTEHRP